MDRPDLIQLNKDIALHASRKKLDEAMSLFNKAESMGSANSHTYAAAINANIRCGSIEGARELFEKLRHSKNLKLDVITCTTMMKGYCGDGNVTAALAILDIMKSLRPVVVPNIRTINTLLRGCVQTGEVEQAEQLVSRMQKEYQLQPDISTWEYLINLLCQSLRLEKVLPIVGRLKSDTTILGELGYVYVNVARASLLLGEWKGCRKAIKNAMDSINLGEQQELTSNTAIDHVMGGDGEDEIDDNDNQTNYNKEVTGGKKAWKKGGNSSSNDGGHMFDSRAQSLTLFRQHKRAELKTEIQLMENLMENLMERKSKNLNNKSGAATTNEFSSYGLLPYFARVFSFSSQTASDNDSNNNKKDGKEKQTLLEVLLKSTQMKFGLDICLQRLASSTSTSIPSTKPDTQPSSSVSSSSSGGEICKDPVSEGSITQHPGVKPGSKKSEKLEKRKRKEEAEQRVNRLTQQVSSLLMVYRQGYDAMITEEKFLDFSMVFQQAEAMESRIRQQLTHPSQTASDTSISSSKHISAPSSSSSGSSYSSSSSSSSSSAAATKSTEQSNKPSKRSRSNDNNEDNSLPLSTDNHHANVKPVKLEICSGAGEWAVLQASADPTSHWVTLELRQDRVYQTFNRAVCAGISNLCILGGDATVVLPRYIAPASISYIYINHPEPPQQTGPGHTSQGKHLLTLDYFDVMARVMAVQGILMINTDNLWFARYLMKMLGGSSGLKTNVWRSIGQKELRKRADLYSNVDGQKNNNQGGDDGGKSGEKNNHNHKKAKKNKGDDASGKGSGSGSIGKGSSSGNGSSGVGGGGWDDRWRVLEEEEMMHGSVTLYEGRAGMECGIASIDASSYFDRLWQRENKVERYFLVLERGTGKVSEKSTHRCETSTNSSSARDGHAKNRSSSSDGGKGSTGVGGGSSGGGVQGPPPATSLELRIGTSLLDAAKTDPATVDERVKKGGYAAQALKAAAFLQSGKRNQKITFDD